MTKVPLRCLLDEPLAAYARTEYTEYHEMLETIFANFDRKPDIAVEAMVPRRCVRQSNRAVVSRWCPRSSAAWAARACDCARSTRRRLR